MTELQQRIATGIALLGICFTSTMIPYAFLAVLASIAAWIVWVEWPRLAPWYTGIIFPGSILVGIGLLYSYEAYQYLLWIAIVSAIIFDTASYIVGRTIGTHTITTISPRKTWEGVIGGVLALYTIGALATCPTCIFTNVNRMISFTIIITTMSSAAFLGDLVISFLKRRRGIKDCSTILPGHGGLLDRIDSILLCVPAAYGLYLLNLL